MAREVNVPGGNVQARAPRAVGRPVVLALAFAEGASVLVVEVVGARGLAPMFGTTHLVWTAQITATLLYLALGYRLGGALSKRDRPHDVGALLVTAGAWLAVYPWLRLAVLAPLAQALGIVGGSFAAATALFAVPLTALGAVTPLFVAQLDRAQPGAGSAAGRLFFVSTMGGLAGGWLSALVLIPGLEVQTTLAATGLFLAVLGAAWVLGVVGQRGRAAAAAAPVGVAVLLLAAPAPPSVVVHEGVRAEVVHREPGEHGLVQVVDVRALGSRYLLVNGTVQGGMHVPTGRSACGFTDFLDIAAWRARPDAKTALVLGLGPGLLARQLHERGVSTLAVEIDPAVVRAARTRFQLPAAVEVLVADGRTVLRRESRRFDLVLLDVYGAESMPWHLVTTEALREVRDRLEPDGVLVANLITRASGSSPALRRVLSTVLAVFPDARLYVDAKNPYSGTDLVNAILVAGEDAAPRGGGYPSDPLPTFREAADALFAAPQALDTAHAPATDDWSDLDWLDATLLLEWRRSLIPGMAGLL